MSVHTAPRPSPRTESAAPTPRPRPIRNGAGPFEKAFKAVVLTIACALVVIPFIGILSTSIAPAEQVTDAGGFVLFPGRSTSPPTGRSSPAASSRGRS